MGHVERLHSLMSSSPTSHSAHCSTTDGNGHTHPLPRLVLSWATATLWSVSTRLAYQGLAGRFLKETADVYRVLMAT